jgi:CDGSH-type Zn-finger protein
MKKKHGNTKIEVTKDGPYLVSGALPLSEQWIVTNAEGDSLEYREGKKYPATSRYALCRCGQSANKPFCDGTHSKVKFDGKETASNEPYLKQAETIEGPPCCSPIRKICARSPASAIQKVKSGIWSSRTAPKPGKL